MYVKGLLVTYKALSYLPFIIAKICMSEGNRTNRHVTVTKGNKCILSELEIFFYCHMAYRSKAS